MTEDAVLAEDYLEHVTPADGNVFADLGFEPAEAENLHIRTRLMIQILRMMDERGLKQKRAAVLFGVSQPRISDLKRGKIDEFTIDSLVNMLGHAGIRIDLAFRPIEQPAREGELEGEAATA
jgi:predicted XRE-type DNA-binding protein